MTIIAQLFAWCEADGTQMVRRGTVYLCGGDCPGMCPLLLKSNLHPCCRQHQQHVRLAAVAYPLRRGITHYTLQARSCAKGGLRPPLESPGEVQPSQSAAPPFFRQKSPISLRRIVEMIDICYNAVSLLDGERLYRNRNGMDCLEGATTMADRKNDQERDELFRRIYKIATDLVHAGHVAEWDFKSYVLGTMFYRYISENFAAYIDKGEHEAGNHDFSYAKLPDDEAETAREDLVLVKGFFILPSELFCNVLARADKDENLNETLERVFNHIESSAASGEAESDFAGLFDDFDVNSKAIGETVAKRNKVLVELLNGVAQMPLFSTDGINPDLFGDAYEYLMGMYAANAGKRVGSISPLRMFRSCWHALAPSAKRASTRSMTLPVVLARCC